MHDQFENMIRNPRVCLQNTIRNPRVSISHPQGSWLQSYHGHANDGGLPLKATLSPDGMFVASGMPCEFNVVSSLSPPRRLVFFVVVADNASRMSIIGFPQCCSIIKDRRMGQYIYGTGRQASR